MNLKKLIVASGAVLSVGVALADARPLPPTSYSPRGLAALWDAIDNAGIGRHEDSLAEWVDLVGGNKITFANSSGPVNAVVTQDPAVQILEDVTASGTCETLSSAREVTVEVRSGANTWWNYGVAGYYFSNMMASLWLQTKANGLYIAYPTSETTAEALHGEVRMEEGHNGEFLTFSLGTRIGGYSLCMNGSPYSYVLGSPSSLAVERSSRFVCSGAKSGSYKLKFNHQSIRIYSRSLTADERRLNALIDEIRYAGKDESDLPGGIRVSPDGTKLQVHIIVRPHGAGVSINNADASTAVYDQWVDVGSEIRSRLRRQRVAAWVGAAFLRTGCSPPTDGRSPLLLRGRGASASIPLCRRMCGRARPAVRSMWMETGRTDRRRTGKMLLC